MSLHQPGPSPSPNPNPNSIPNPNPHPNSALQDAAALVDYLLAEVALQPTLQPEGGTADGTAADVVGGALLQYSQGRVPEGRALLELSTGPGRAASNPNPNPNRSPNPDPNPDPNPNHNPNPL